MYINIDSKFLDKNREKANKEAIANVGEEDGKDSLVFNLDKESIESIEVDEDNLRVSIANDLGYFGIDIPLNDFLMQNIISEVIKRMNKFKTMLEALK